MDHEKLGLFYLGRRVDPRTGTTSDVPVLYDSSDLVTHAAIVGMTGSGKTGLGITVIEEAALDGIPVIAIDPKGDLPNLLLTFPSLSAGAFAPWVNEDEARVAGQDASAFAAREAERWKSGLAAWGQDGARVQRFRDAAVFDIYTPGSALARPLSMMRSFRAPASALLDDGELFADRVSTTATGILILAGLETDPVRSREHLLVSALLSEAWKNGRDLDLPALIAQVQAPPIARVGVLELETLYPSADRFELAVRLNHVLAAPDFTQWLAGDPLEIGSLLHHPSGKPRVSIVSIAHLDDRERMFFVSLLLNEVVAWVRAQRGTSSLRALLYFDEVMGFLPPVSNPASKAPMLRLLKQARAFGLGCVLATQNPVDLDYKALANAGTWLIGRLQTERDKARVLDGLETVAAATGAGGPARADLDRTISALQKRQFVLHNVHEPGPLVFETRWALSYLRGPLGRDEMRRLKESSATVSAETLPSAGPVPAPVEIAARPPEPATVPPSTLSDQNSVTPPVVPFDQFFLPGTGRVWRPALIGLLRITYTDAKLGVDEVREVSLLTPISEGPVAVDWDQAEPVTTTARDLKTEPDDRARPFAPLPRAAAQASSYKKWSAELTRWAAQSQTLELLRELSLKATSHADESEAAFRERLDLLRREARDAAVQKVREKFRSRLERAEAKVRRAEAASAREAQQASDSKMQAGVSVAATIFGALLGKKAVSASTLGRATTAARGMGRVGREAQDTARAEAEVARAREERDAVAAEAEEAMAAVAAAQSSDGTLERVLVRPKRGGVSLQLLALVWVAE